MDDVTLQALRGSIAKWEAIVAGTGRDHGARNCPLCEAFPASTCRGCPVEHASGDPGCGATPYEYWHKHHTHMHGSNYDEGFVVECDECRTLAQAELDFLRSLLPPETTNGEEAAHAL